MSFQSLCQNHLLSVKMYWTFKEDRFSVRITIRARRTRARTFQIFAAATLNPIDVYKQKRHVWPPEELL
jgi:type IV secretory pathway VirB3-like protein